MIKSNGITLNNEDYAFIPPAPSGEDRGGITESEYNNYNAALEDVSQLNEDLSKVTATEIIKYYRHNRCIDLSGDSVAIGDDGKPVEMTGWASYSYSITECVAGDIFTITGHGGTQARLWGFISNDGTILLKSLPDTSINGRMFIVAPDESKWLILHDYAIYERISYKGRYIPLVIDKIEDAMYKSSGVPIPITYEHRYVDLTGDSITFDSEGNPVLYPATATTDFSFIECKPDMKVTINAIGGNASRAWAFIKSDGTILSKAEANAVLEGVILTAPQNTKYLILHNLSTNKTTSFLGEHMSAIAKDVRSNEVQINANKNDVQLLFDYTQLKSIESENDCVVNYNINDSVACENGVPTKTTLSGFKSYLIKCKSGDSFVVKGVGGGETARLYMFLPHISDSDTGVYPTLVCPSEKSLLGLDNEILTIPAGVEWLAINIHGDGYVYQKDSTDTYEYNLFSMNGNSVIACDKDHTGIPTKVNSTVLNSMVTECDYGDKIKISGIGGSGTGRLWAFFSSSGRLMACAEPSEIATDKTMIVPYGTKYLVVNITNETLSNFKLAITRNSKVAESITNNTVGVSEIKSLTDDILWTTGKVINADSSSTKFGQEANTVYFTASGYFDISNYDLLNFTSMRRESQSSNGGCVFYDNEYNPIQAILRVNESNEMREETCLVPKDAKYIRFSRLNLSACNGFYANGIKLDKMSPLNISTEQGENNHIRFMVFGNSYGMDSITYVPFILKNIGITCEIFLYRRDACSLRDIYNRWESTAERDEETDGIHTGSYLRRVYAIDTRKDSSWRTLDRVSMKTCLEYGKWDFVTLQQWSAYSIDADTYSPWLQLDIDLIRQSIDKSTLLAWTQVCTRATHDDRQASIEVFRDTVAKKYPFDFVIPYGTAIFNALANENLALLGDAPEHNFRKDSVHLQDGLPRYVASLTVCESICRKFFPKKSVMFDKTRPTDQLITSWGNGMPMTPCVGINEANCLLAQYAAINACNHPFEIIPVESLPTPPQE